MATSRGGREQRRGIVVERGSAGQPRKQAARRRVWDNPILWREVRTWAYGRKMLLLRLAYLMVFAASAAGLYWTVAQQRTPSMTALALPIVPLFVLSLALVNVQAVTSLTASATHGARHSFGHRHHAGRVHFRQAGRRLYNTKEMVLLPMALCLYLAIIQQVSIENTIYLLGGWLVMVGFVTMLGVHCGMNYANSRAASSASVGTVFFLFIGVATCMRIMVAFSGSFQFQLQPFLAFMVGGGIGLLVALGGAMPRRDLDRGFRLPLRHVLRLDQLFAGLHVGRAAGRGRDVRIRHGGDAGAGDP